MRAKLPINAGTRSFSLLGFVALIGCAPAQAQIAPQTAANSPSAWQSYDWLSPSADRQQATPDETFHATMGQDVNDPFLVLSTGALWQEKYGAVDTRQIGDGLSLSCETSTVTLDEDSEDLSHSEKMGFQFQPIDQLTLHGDLHDSASDAPVFGESTTTNGAAISAESQLPLNAVLTLGMESDRTSPDAPTGLDTRTDAYDAQWKQPIGQLPLSAVVKGHIGGTSDAGGAATSLPSLEQSLVWKPMQDTTIQAGLRQQQYQEYPGVDHLLNEALFADWSQKVVDNVSWHSYAEILNSKGLIDQAPAAPIASGASAPGSNASVTSSLPVSVDNQTLTFSTGPSFKLQKDISASVEYSDRWDKNPSPGSTGDEQRVSVSVKGTF
jgi:hypothetical protein